MMHAMTETDLRAIESRLEAAEYLYADGRPDPNAAACLDWTRAVAMPDMRGLLAEVRRLQAEVARMHLNTTTETRAEWADPS